MKRDVWITSTRSGNNGQCVEVKAGGDAVHVRDSKNRLGPNLLFAPGQWAAFISSTKNGQFDLD